MRLTDFLASVGRDFNLQQKFWRSEASRLADDEEFLRLLGHHGWNNLRPDHQELLRVADLCEIQRVLVDEAREGGGGSSAEVTGHQHGVFGPCWVLVRV
jgi:hypothetical protein